MNATAPTDLRTIRFAVKGAGIFETVSRPGATSAVREILNGDGRWLPAGHPNLFSVVHNGRVRGGEAIRGRVTAHECNAKCLNSKGHICECSCGGKNHGAGVATKILPAQ